MNVTNQIVNKSNLHAIIFTDLVSKVFKKVFTLWILKTINIQLLIDKISLKLNITRKNMFLIALLLSITGLGLLNLEYYNTSLFAFVLAFFNILYVIYTVLYKKYKFQNIVELVNDRINNRDLEKQLLTLGMTRIHSRSLREMSDNALEIVLAEWDQNNNVRLLVNGLRSLEEIQTTSEEYTPRERNKLQLVIHTGFLAVKKRYETIPCMMNEVFALNQLNNNSYVPKLLKIIPSEKLVYLSYIPGRNLGNLLKQQGLTVTMQHHNALNNSSSNIFHNVINNILSTKQIEMLKFRLKQIHSAGVAIRDIKYGNIILQGDDIYFCDFDAAYTGNTKEYRLYKERCYDTIRFNELFATDLATGRDGDLALFNNDISPECYAPIYIGKGVGYGKVGSIEFGTGKWQLIKHHLPNLMNKVIIDFGSNNGNLPLEMLRAGAKHVTGFELNQNVYKLAKRNHHLYEFVDNQIYSFDLNNNYMHGVLDTDISNYDMATSFCSLYYESVDIMEKITGYLSRNVKVFVVQANENQGEHVGEMLEKSSVAFLQKLLAKNGFTQQEVVRFPCYDRPIIIAYSDYN